MTLGRLPALLSVWNTGACACVTGFLSTRGTPISPQDCNTRGSRGSALNLYFFISSTSFSSSSSRVITPLTRTLARALVDKVGSFGCVSFSSNLGSSGLFMAAGREWNLDGVWLTCQRHTMHATSETGRTLFALASRSASGASATSLALGDAALADMPSGVPVTLLSPLPALLRGVESRGAQGEVSGLLLRAAAGAALDRIF
jgi:hypothetical protein